MNKMIENVNKSKIPNKTRQNILYSFDIFDTLVTRTLLVPEGIFSLVKKQLKNFAIPEVLKTDFIQIRTGIEEFARNNSLIYRNISEVTFDEIYEIIKQNYNLSDEITEQLKNIEIETEIKNLRPITENVNKLKNLISAGNRVILITDMYYTEEILHRILSHIDKIFDGIKIYSSADCKSGKYNGYLYEIVKNTEHVDYKNWVHTGDNAWSDISVAHKKGIKTKYFSPFKLKEYQQYCYWRDPENAYIQLLLGAGRLACINNLNNAENKKIYEFGATFAAPIMYMYADWIIKQAIYSNYKTLYFIARDGYVPKLIADIIIKKNNLPIKTKYLYGSRLTWRIPSESNYGNYIDTLFNEYKDRLSLEFISYRLGVAPERFKDILKIKSVSKLFSSKEIKYYRDLFLKDSSIKGKILNALNEKREILKDYFKQEIDFSEANIAFVDLNGTGKTQDYISDILNEISPCSVHTMYYPCEYWRTQQCISKKLSFYNGPRFSFWWWIELLGRTKDGQTIGYLRKGKRITPVMEKNNTSIIKWGFNDYIKGITDYTELIIDIINENNFSQISGAKLYYYILCFINEQLDKETAEILGDIPWATVGQEDGYTAAAGGIGAKKALYCLFSGNKILGDFPKFVYARSNKFCRKIFDFNAKYGNLRKFLINININKKNKVFEFRVLGLKISMSHFIYRSK